jgi:hypothetical protein
MARYRILTSLAPVVAFVLSPASITSAQDDRRARLHFESGASYYESGEYEDALREFQRAYELSRRPQLLFNISLCYQNLGDFERAAAYLERYLNEAPDVENRANLEIRLRRLRERIARPTSSVGEAGPRAGEATPSAAASAGSGGEGSGGGSASATSSEQGSSAGPTDGGGAVSGTSGQEERAPPAAGQAARPRRSIGGTGGGPNAGAIAGFSFAGAGLIVAGIFGSLTVAEDARLAGTPCGLARTCTDPDLGDLRAFAAVTDVGFGVALAGAVVGVLFLALGAGPSPNDQTAQSSFHVVPLASRDGAGLFVQRRL